ncbi:MAG TPA: hypothetical protein VIM16_15875 [Mucilaginibacter sp.]
MNITRINIIAHKTICIICFVALFFIGVKILSDNLYVKGVFSMTCSGIFILLLLQKPSLRTWLQIVAVIVIAVMIIGELERI